MIDQLKHRPANILTRVDRIHSELGLVSTEDSVHDYGTWVRAKEILDETLALYMTVLANKDYKLSATEGTFHIEVPDDSDPKVTRYIHVYARSSV